MQNDRLSSFLYNSGSLNLFSPNRVNVPDKSICLAFTCPWMCRLFLWLQRELGLCICGWNNQREHYKSWNLEALGHLIALPGLCGPINQGHRWAGTKDQNDLICFFHTRIALLQQISEYQSLWYYEYFLKFLFIVMTYWWYMCLNRYFLSLMKLILLLITMESQWRAYHRINDSNLRLQWGYRVRTWIMLLIHPQTMLYDMRSSLKYNSCSSPQTFDSECPRINSAYKSQVILMWLAFGNQQYTAVIYTIMTKVTECLLLLMQLVADLFL